MIFIPSFFTPYLHLNKSKTSPNQLIKRRFPYPEPGSNRHDIAVIGV